MDKQNGRAGERAQGDGAVRGFALGDLRSRNHMVLRQRLCVDNEPFSDEIDHLGVLGMYHCPHAQRPCLQHDVEHLAVA